MTVGLGISICIKRGLQYFSKGECVRLQVLGELFTDVGVGWVCSIDSCCSDCGWWEDTLEILTKAPFWEGTFSRWAYFNKNKLG